MSDHDGDRPGDVLAMLDAHGCYLSEANERGISRRTLETEDVGRFALRTCLCGARIGASMPTPRICARRSARSRSGRLARVPVGRARDLHEAAERVRESHLAGRLRIRGDERG